MITGESLSEIEINDGKHPRVWRSLRVLSQVALAWTDSRTLLPGANRSKVVGLSYCGWCLCSSQSADLLDSRVTSDGFQLGHLFGLVSLKQITS